MMISKAMQDAINEHIGAEMYSANLYLAMAAYCESRNLKGFAKWMRIQWKEEMEHAFKFFDYMNDRGGSVVVSAVALPPSEYKSPREVFEQTLEHEKHISARISRLYELAMEEKDYPTQNMLQWFISEQVEEEARATEVAEKLRMIGESSNSIFWLDKELGKRQG